MKTKHTATPWEVSEFREGFKRIIVAHDGTVATVAGTSDTEAETQANAKFITLACNHHEELIAVLTDCLQSLERLPDTDGAYRVTCIQQAKNLLTKLKG